MKVINFKINLNLREQLISLNQQVQNYEYDGNIGTLVNTIPEKLIAIATLMTNRTKHNEAFYSFIKSRSIEWLYEDAKNLKTLGAGANDIKRVNWLTFAQKWANQAIKSFFNHCNYFEKDILDK